MLAAIAQPVYDAYMMASEIGKTIGVSSTPWHLRAMAVLLGICIAIVFSALLFLALVPPLMISVAVFLIAVILVLVVSCWRYRRLTTDVVARACLVSLLWGLVCVATLPTAIERYYLIAADGILPECSGPHRTAVGFTRADMTTAATVRYAYYPARRDVIYQQLDACYKESLMAIGYKVNDEVKGSYVIFRRLDDSSPIVFLGVSEQSMNEINVHVGF